jgi:hypothetical protein
VLKKKEMFELVESTCRKLTEIFAYILNSNKFKITLETVLSLGNYINGESAKG